MTERELVSMVIEEIMEYKLAQNKEDNAVYTALRKEVTALSKCMQDIQTKLSEEDADILNRYMSKTSFLADRDCKYLYEQGAKDCVRLLKQLGIL